MSAHATETVTTVSARPGAEYAALAFGYEQATDLVQVLGLQSGKNAGQPAVAAVERPGGGWTPEHFPLTRAVAPASLTDLVVSTGYSVTEAVGLDQQGHLYLVGSQGGDGAWQAGPGRFDHPTTFAAGSLSAQAINTSTVFALTRQGAPCVALYRDPAAPSRWQPGYPLPLPAGFDQRLTWLGARPDAGNAGTTHAIGLTADGQACAIACASGSGTGPANWRPGRGILGDLALPVFTQLLLVPGDAAGNFHVIGLGQDGSVWDIDQYAARAVSPAWTGRSVKIFAGGKGLGPRIDCYLYAPITPQNFSINLVAWGGPTPVVFAQYWTTWSATTTTIPTSGTTDRWYLVNDLTSARVHLLGLSLVGNVHTIARFANGLWTAGSKHPING